jgi:hypothetical protein
MMRYVEKACQTADQRSHKPSAKSFRTGKVATLPEPHAMTLSTEMDRVTHLDVCNKGWDLAG